VTTTARHRFVFTQAQCLGMDLDDIGGCTACGETAYGVEPDARRYECDHCGAKRVYGAQELMLMDLVDIEDD